MPSQKEIVSAIESFAAPSLQEPWDNTGWQLTPHDPATTECTGALLCLDVTPATVEEAYGNGCNLIISHHPLIFKGLRSITGASQVERAVLEAIRRNIAVYSSHTALDSASRGVSHELGQRLGLIGMRVLVPRADNPSAGLGVTGSLPALLTALETIQLVRKVYDSPTVRVTQGPDGLEAKVDRIALCSGSGGEFITAAINTGAQIYITSDVRYHDFLDYGKEIIIIDTGHFESEKCTKSIFSLIISEKFPNFAVHISQSERNPVTYLP